ncbi:MAG: hypothetical protein ACE5G2_06405 [Candidatus Krumholzibacteriia bacterium]
MSLTALLWSGTAAAADPASERLVLLADVGERTAEVEVGVMKPFDVYLVAERDQENPQISAVVFKLELPEGVLLIGEELLVESLIALGTPKAGLNLAFHCVESQQVKVYHFRLAARRPLAKAVVRLAPDPRTNFLGVVSCKDENYDKWASEESTFTITATPDTR